MHMDLQIFISKSFQSVFSLAKTLSKVRKMLLFKQFLLIVNLVPRGHRSWKKIIRWSWGTTYKNVWQPLNNYSIILHAPLTLIMISSLSLLSTPGYPSFFVCPMHIEFLGKFLFHKNFPEKTSKNLKLMIEIYLNVWENISAFCSKKIKKLVL